MGLPSLMLLRTGNPVHLLVSLVLDCLVSIHQANHLGSQSRLIDDFMFHRLHFMDC